MVEIPYTSFNGMVRQFETKFPQKIMSDLYNMCFTAFDDLDRFHASFLKEGIKYFVTAAGTQRNFGSRPRRFAGGPGLSPESYFTICGDAGDHGTLRDELTAYYGAKSGVTVTIYDPCVDSWVIDVLRDMGVTDLDVPLFYLVYQLEQTIDSEDLDTIRRSDPSIAVGERIGVTYGIRQSELNLSHVIDLRNPDVQDWFTDSFVALEVEEASHSAERGRVIHLSLSGPPSTFGELLPVITSLETGGGMVFSQAVGAWLRSHGCDGLIFPGSRSNAHNVVEDGTLQASGGWNLVSYAGATPSIDDSLFGLMGPWRDPDHDHIRVNYVAEGSRRGSFSIRGAREYNLIDFDLKRRHVSGVRDDDNVVASVTGVRTAQISQAVNQMLDNESADRDIWYQDADYIGILDWLEKGWRAS